MQRVGHGLVAGQQRNGVRRSDPALSDWRRHRSVYAVGAAPGVVAGVLSSSMLSAGLLIVHLSA